MSPTISSMLSQQKNPKGKKIPGKPGRFDPTEPMHMTTRHNARKSISGGAPSANGSVKNSESRRPSLDAERPVTANSNGTLASKGTFASEYSPQQPAPDVEMHEAPPPLTYTDVNINGQRISRTPSREPRASPVHRKRKRSSPSPPPAPPDDMVFPANNVGSVARLPGDDYDSDTVEVVRQDELSDREESGDEAADDEEEESPRSSQSREAVPTYDAMAGTSVDITPMLSEQASPVTSGSPDDEEDQDQDTTIAKPLAAALKEVAEAKNDEPLEPEQPDDEPMLDVAAGIVYADEIEEQVRTDEDGRMVVRRGKFGGRRRAQHPNLDIEVAMRRQAQLKTAYRAIARAQKSMLAEIAQRNIDDLEANQTRHTEVEEYEEIIRELDVALAKRKAVVQAQHEMRLKQLTRTWDGEMDVIVSKCRQQLEDVEETKVDQLQYEFLRIARNAQLEDGNETEDEDDLIPRPKRTAYHWKRGAGLEPVYESRSRLAIEIQSATKDMQARYNMYEMLRELPDEDKPEKRNGFAVMDERPRTAASKNREGQDTLDVLVAAGAETERVASIPVIPNEHALGLQMLGDLASRPSIVGGRPQSSSAVAGPLIGAAGPPQLHLQVPRGGSPIHVQMSPRTQHAMGNRFEQNQMPPPLTPRQDTGFPVSRSPEARRHERRPSSPGRDERPKGLHGPPNSDFMRSPARRKITDPETLHHRIANRDGMLQESLFGSPGMFQEYPGFRGFGAPDGQRRRAASHSDSAPPFGIRPDPSQDQRSDDPRGPPRPDMYDEFKDESRRFDPVRPQPLRWPDQHSHAGASNGRSRETASPKSEQLSIAGTPGPPHSSVAGPDAAWPGNQRSQRGGKYGSFPNKTNKDRRDGKSRSQYSKEQKRQRQQQQQHENGQLEPSSTPTMSHTPFTSSPPSSAIPWFAGIGQAAPRHSPQEHHPPPLHLRHHSASYGPSQPHRFPPPNLHHPPSFDNAPQHPQHHQGAIPTPGYGWDTPRPFFPGAPQHPPPPGVDHYRLPIQPPPPPGYQHPPQHPPHFPPHTPGTPHPQSAPGSGPGFGFNNHTNGFGRGQPLMPAAFRPGAPGQQTPAFQQLQSGGGSGGGNGGRRRAQSDARPFPRFMPSYEGPKEKRG